MGSFTLGVARTIQKYGTATMAAALHLLTKLDYLTQNLSHFLFHRDISPPEFEEMQKPSSSPPTNLQSSLSRR